MSEEAPLGPFWNGVAIVIVTILEWGIAVVVWTFAIASALIPVVVLYVFIRFVRWAWSH